MMKGLLKNAKFITGALFVVCLFIASVFYGFVFHDFIPKFPVIYGDGGAVKHLPIYTPLEHPPFGTNVRGQGLFFMILVGARYTLGVAFIVTLCRFLLSSMIGMLGETYFPNIFRKFSRIGDVLHYIPAALLIYFILNNNTLENFNFSERVLIDIIILILIALPVSTQTIANETRKVYSMEFIEGVKTIGGSKWYILTNHIRVFLTPELFIIVARELMQVLLLFAHLAVLHIFIGGGKLIGKVLGLPFWVSYSNEWAGLLGKNFNRIIIGNEPWMGLVPLFCITVTIIAVKLAIEGMKETFQTEETSKRFQRPHDQDTSQELESTGEKSFTFVRKDSGHSYDS